MFHCTKYKPDCINKYTNHHSLLRFEIAEHEKLPRDHPEFKEMMEEITNDPVCVKKNERFPALSVYKYSKNKMQDITAIDSRAEVAHEESDISKKKLEVIN